MKIDTGIATEAINRTEAVKTEPVKEAKAEEVKTETAPKRDTYERKEEVEGIGLYKPETDADGKTKISFDSPEAKAETAETAEASTEAPKAPEAKAPAVKTDANSLEKLNKEKQKLKMQLKTADPSKRGSIEKKIKAIDSKINKARLAK